MAEQHLMKLNESSKKDNEIDIIFLHGLGGDIKETWINKDNVLWPEWLESDFPASSVYLAGHNAKAFKSWIEDETDLHEAAHQLLLEFSLANIGEKPIIFIVHSLGGILTKEILRKSEESNNPEMKRISKNTKAVYFIATPHTKVSLATFGKLILPHLTSDHTKLLAGQGGYLQCLLESYKSLVTKYNIKTMSFYEKKKYNKMGIIVPREAADPSVQDCTPTAINNEDHISIAKPESVDTLIYRTIRRGIQNIQKHDVSLSAFDATDYSQNSTDDRRDLLQKLVDANRQHEYGMANEMQTRFATKYTKQGLHPTAKADHDLILSDVEQRFKYHVYQDYILTGKDNLEIKEAIQRFVIDPIYKKHEDNKPVSTQSILDALYYLTQKCHISWN